MYLIPPSPHLLPLSLPPSLRPLPQGEHDKDGTGKRQYSDEAHPSTSGEGNNTHNPLPYDFSARVVLRPKVKSSLALPPGLALLLVRKGPSEQVAELDVVLVVRVHRPVAHREVQYRQGRIRLPQAQVVF